MMNLILFLLFLLSIIYCCDEPVFFKGCEMLVNNHDSMLYGIGLSVIAAYIFYIFQVVIPQFLRFKQTQVIGSVKLEDICALIEREFDVLRGKPKNSKVLMDGISDYLDNHDIFSDSSRIEIHEKRVYSVFEALVYNDNKIMALVDEILSVHYLEPKYEKYLFKLKTSQFHKNINWWKDNKPGEYELCEKEKGTGYIVVNIKSVNSDIIFSLEEYLSIYDSLKKYSNKLYGRFV